MKNPKSTSKTASLRGQSWFNPWLMLAIGLIAIACGSGGGDSLATTTISGTGSGGGTTTLSKVSGPIDQFGSVYVGGIAFDTDGLAPNIEGQSAALSELSLGMWVSVEGNIDLSTLSGKATSLHYEAHHAGNISSMLPNGHFVLNDITVETDTFTHIDPKLPDPLTVNTRLQLSGQYLASGNFYATHLGQHPQTWKRKRSRQDLALQIDEQKLQTSHIEIEDLKEGDIWRSGDFELDFKNTQEGISGEARPPKPGEKIIFRGQKLPSGKIQVLSWYSRKEDKSDISLQGIISAISLRRPASITIDQKSIAVESYTVFEDRSTLRLRRFGLLELKVGDQVKLEFYPNGKLKKLTRTSL